ncbi:hypothetical protein GGQ84_001694 [Desulfitispora alkaliphila]|uniref:DUF4230 domain-containing protein n=1 Tax=Desulfitispora alkaliphila TaxID=622674 RepID=UPI003D1D431F
MSKLRTILICICILFFGALVLNNNLDRVFVNQQTIKSSTVKEKIKDLWELSTVQYVYTNVVVFEDKWEFAGTSLPFTGKSFLIKYTGYIKAGVNLDNVEIEILDSDSISITVSQAQIIANVINEEEVYIYDERSSLFNRLSISDLYSILPAEKEAMEAEVVEQGFLEDANEKAKLLLEGLLNSMGFNQVVITFK